MRASARQRSYELQGVHSAESRNGHRNGHDDFRSNAMPSIPCSPQSRVKRRKLLITVALRTTPPIALLPSIALGQVVPATEAPALPNRSVWLAPTYQTLFTDAFAPSAHHGLGLGASYEFHVTSTFNLGLTLAYRMYPGQVATHQLGYGTILKHFFDQHWSTRDGVFPFLDYGLLLQQTFVSGREGSATSHDTRLGGGLLFRFGGFNWFTGVAYHYSRLQFFDRKSTWIPYLDAQLGWLFSWL